MFFLVAASSEAIEKPETELSKSGIDTKQGQKINLDLSFTNALGEKKSLKELIDNKKPIILVPVYYGCPRLCGMLLGGVTKLLRDLDLRLSEDYQVVTLSFDDTEGFELAKKKSEKYYSDLSLSADQTQSWNFLVGDSENIHSLMSQIGFRYFKDKDEFVHAATIIILTPQGEISQYFTGVEFSPWDVRLALIEASQGKIGSIVDHILLFCFRYDHLKGKYIWAVSNFIRAGGAISLLFLIAVVIWASRRSRVVKARVVKS
jgi:protein SCO1